ncbi:MAG TPA: hypothetical protein VF941_14290 [Clostridia bacterium]
MAVPSTNWTPASTQSTDWNKNSSLSGQVKANSTTVQANSTTVYATGYLTANPNILENINSTNYTSQYY